MNRHIKQLSMIVLSILFFGLDGMEHQQPLFMAKEPLSMVQCKMITCALSKLLFVENEKILHIGFRCEDIIQEKSRGCQAYCINADTLGMLGKPEVGYDKILSFACWDVIVNPQEAFTNSVTLLKENGQFCVVLPYYKSPYLKVHRETLMSDTWKDRYDKTGMVGFYGSKAVKRLLEKAGFNGDTKCFIIKKPFIFETKEKLTSWIASCPEQLHLLPRQDHAEFIDDVVANYLQEYPLKDDNSVQLYLPYMIVRASKS